MATRTRPTLRSSTASSTAATRAAASLWEPASWPSSAAWPSSPWTPMRAASPAAASRWPSSSWTSSWPVSPPGPALDHPAGHDRPPHVTQSFVPHFSKLFCARCFLLGNHCPSLRLRVRVISSDPQTNSRSLSPAQVFPRIHLLSSQPFLKSHRWQWPEVGCRAQSQTDPGLKSHLWRLLSVWVFSPL